MILVKSGEYRPGDGVGELAVASVVTNYTAVSTSSQNRKNTSDFNQVWWLGRNLAGKFL